MGGAGAVDVGTALWCFPPELDIAEGFTALSSKGTRACVFASAPVPEYRALGHDQSSPLQERAGNHLAPEYRNPDTSRGDIQSWSFDSFVASARAHHGRGPFL